MKLKVVHQKMSRTNYLAKTNKIVKNFMFRLIYNEYVKKTCKKNYCKPMLMAVAAVVAVAALYYYSQGFSNPLSGMSNSNEAAEAVDESSSSCAAGGNNFVPAAPMGQNSGEGQANGAVTDTYGLLAVLNNNC